MSKVKFIDLFAGLGGIRIGFEQACKERGIETECVLTSEIKHWKWFQLGASIAAPMSEPRHLYHSPELFYQSPVL